MIAEDVLQIVTAAIGDDWNRPTSHGIDLRNAVLRPPQLVTAVVPGHEPRKVWLCGSGRVQPTARDTTCSLILRMMPTGWPHAAPMAHTCTSELTVACGTP